MLRKSIVPRMILTGIIVCQAFVLVNCACYPRDYREFFDQPRAKQISEFRASSLERQFDIFLLDLRCRHPRDLELSEIIAMRGEEAIPFLEERFRESKSELQQAAILGIFASMSIMHSADFRNYEELLVYLEQKTASMKNPSFRSWSERDLQYIREMNERLDSAKP